MCGSVINTSKSVLLVFYQFCFTHCAKSWNSNQHSLADLNLGNNYFPNHPRVPWVPQVPEKHNL
jgi:hypothetical protein